MHEILSESLQHKSSDIHIFPQKYKNRHTTHEATKETNVMQKLHASTLISDNTDLHR